MSVATPEGWHGWDSYAEFYDWENARTLGRRDVAFWRGLVGQLGVPTLELGCGTGRLLAPVARTGVPLVGIDRSEAMLRYAERRISRLPRTLRPLILRGDIRALPFKRARFGFVMAAYGLTQSLLDDDDLDAMFSEIARVLRPGGLAGFDLVPDLPAWEEYSDKVIFRGTSRRGGRITLTETVRQKARRGLTIFDDEFVERRGRHVERRRFTLTFRTIPLDDLRDRLGRAGLRVQVRYGDYRGGPLTPAAGAWLILAQKA
jgi:ubiquinone/menaquinone biosynthesis C-methylase UbiE